MPMKTSTKLVKVLLTNIPIAISISLVASYIGIQSAPDVPADKFVEAWMGSTMINILLSYIISFFVGWFLPVEKWGFGFASKFSKPQDGLKFGLLLNLVVNTVYVVFNAVILTFVNANLMQGLPIAMFPFALAGSFLQCWVVGYIVSFLWAQKAEAIARKAMNDPAPEMH